MKNQQKGYQLPGDEDDEDKYENDQNYEDDEEVDEDQDQMDDDQDEEEEEGTTPETAMANAQNQYQQQQMNNNFQYNGQGQVQNMSQNRMNPAILQNQNQGLTQGRLRPQSAKTDDMKFQQQQQQQIYMAQQQQNPQWIGAQQNNYMSGGDQQQPQQQYPYPMPQQYTVPYGQGGFYQPLPSQGSLNIKKRPTTASRRNQQFGNQGQKKSFGSKNPSTLDLEVSRLRPRIIHQERERLYDDAMKQKITANNLKDENVKLKTRIHIIEGEMNKKDKLIDDLLMQQDSFQQIGNTGLKSQKLKLDSHLAQNLKRKIRECQGLLMQKQEENEILKKNIRSTKITELEVEMKQYSDECVRMRHQLEEVIKSKDTFADPDELKAIEEKFQQQEALIQQLRGENQEMAVAYQKKDDENRQMREMLAENEKKRSKASQALKESAKLKKVVRSQEKEMTKIRQELGLQKQVNDDYKSKIEELIKKGSQGNNTQQQYQSRPSTVPQFQGSNTNDAEAKRLRQEVQDKDSKIKELNGVVTQLQQKLQEKINEVTKEQFEKNKFKSLYEQYQDQVAKLEAQIEDAYSHKPVAHFEPKKQELKSIPKQKTQENIQEQPVKKDQSIVKESETLKTVQMTSVKKSEIENTILELKFKLISKAFYPAQIKEFFFKPFQGETEVTVKLMQDIFETNGLEDKKALLIARYLIEPKNQLRVGFSEQNSATQKDILKDLSELIGDYKLYNDGSQVKKYQEQIQKAFIRCKDTLRETLQMEDYNEEGVVPVSAFKEAFETLEIDLDDDVFDYMLYSIYSKSESIERMNYQILIDIIDGKFIQGQLSVGSESRKRPESSSPEKLKARNKDKFQANQQEQQKQKKQTITDENEEEDYEEEEFEKLLDKDDEESDSKKPQPQQQQDSQDGDQQEEDDEYIDEEMMLDVAEKCFVRIAEGIIKSGTSVRQAFLQFIISEEMEDGEPPIELLSPIGFLEGVKDLGITDLEEVEVACLMRVLTKPDLDNAILLRELIVIMENFGIQDDDAEDGEDNGAAEAAAEQEIEQESQKQLETSQQQNQEQPAKKKKKKKGAAAKNTMDLQQLDEKSIKILAKLMLALMQLNVTLYDFFDGVVYEQLVKTKTKQNTVEIINTKDFFEILQQRGVRKKTTEHENLSKFLQLDPNYPNLIMLKKVAKALDEMAKNEDLMAGLLEAAGDDMEGDEYGYDGEAPNGGQQQRLITIGEDEEERQFESNKNKNQQKQNTKQQQPQQQDEEDDEQYYQDEQDQNNYEDGNDDYEF